MFFLGIVAIVISFVVGRSEDVDFLIIRKYALLCTGICFVISSLAIDILKIGTWFLAISIPGSLLLTLWVYLKDKNKNKSDQ